MIYLIILLLNYFHLIIAGDNRILLYRIVEKNYKCPEQGPSRCSLIEVEYENLRKLNYIQIPEITSLFFKKRLHWEYKGSFLIEFSVRMKNKYGYIVMLYGSNRYGFGFMEFDGKKYSFEYKDHIYMILKKWRKINEKYFWPAQASKKNTTSNSK